MGYLRLGCKSEIFIHFREGGWESEHNALQNTEESKSGKTRSVREEVLAARKCENINDPVDTYFVDYVAMAWSKLFIALHIIPNVVTMLAMISGIAGGVLLIIDRSFWMDLAGAVLVFHSAVFDASDGQVARLTKHYSRLGRMLDGMSDASVYLSLYLACVIRLWSRSLLSNPGLWHGLLIALGAGVFFLYIIQCQLPDYFKNLHMYSQKLVVRFRKGHAHVRFAVAHVLEAVTLQNDAAVLFIKLLL